LKKPKLDDYFDSKEKTTYIELERIEEFLKHSTRVIREDIARLEKKLDKLEELVTECQRTSTEKPRVDTRSKPTASSKVAEFIEEHVKKQGFVMLSTLINELGVKPKAALSIARRSGFHLIEARGDYILTSIATLVELENRLSHTHSTDINEASRRAGDLLPLFEVLRRNGMVYYDARIKGWKISIE